MPVFQAFDADGNSLGRTRVDRFGDNAAGGGTEEDRFFGVVN